ncbi:energy transducer TonB family protein [Sphingobium sp. DN12]|uniref:energy transducer TonB family protein n=1 Tax=Sphingobium sp. DN12 TaxID=3378073 RepID=UPI003DA21D73
MTVHASALTDGHLFDVQVPMVNASCLSAQPCAAPSGRYCDQPVSLGTRLFGMGGVLLVVLLVIGGALFTWTTLSPAQSPAHLAVFDVAPPAAPPEPQSEVPPGPEQIQKEKAEVQPDRPKVDLPEIQLPSENPVTIEVQKPVIDPGPPIEKTTAPESRPLPPAPQQSNAKPTWEGLVLGALNKVKRYPREAAFRRQQGVPYIRFVMNRDGKVLSVRLERSSGHSPLDDEAVSLPKRAQPLPKPPEEVKGETIELVVPVEFFMR